MQLWTQLRVCSDESFYYRIREEELLACISHTGHFRQPQEAEFGKHDFIAS
jgi:hypothetical protein